MPCDRLTRRLAKAVQHQPELLARLTDGIALSDEDDDLLGRLEAAFAAQQQAEPVEQQLANQGIRYRPTDGDYAAWVDRLLERNAIDQAQAALLRDAARLTDRAVAVDAFPIRAR